MSNWLGKKSNQLHRQMRRALVCEVFQGMAVSPSWPCPNIPRLRIDVFEVGGTSSREWGKRGQCVLLLLTPVTSLTDSLWCPGILSICECSPSDGSLEVPLHRFPTLFLTVSYLATPTLLQPSSQFTHTDFVHNRSLCTLIGTHTHPRLSFPLRALRACIECSVYEKFILEQIIRFLKNMLNIIRGMSQSVSSI